MRSESGPGTVAELFAGVGGFRLGLERAGWETVWSNQWEPSTKRQHASDCYVSRFGPDGHVCDDIAVVLDRAEAGEAEIPDVDLLCGGFPCQDYSVSKPLPQALGLRGKKGVLWWEIHRFLALKRPRIVLLENVDRLLKSPASQRGRDFAVMLACLSDLGYVVEWRVVNAAEYGFPQRRRRVFVCARLASSVAGSGDRLILSDGVLARAFPVRPEEWVGGPALSIDGDVYELSETFGRGLRHTPFRSAGAVWDRKVWTMDVRPDHEGPFSVLGDVLDDDVPARFYIPRRELKAWRYLKGAKRERRTHASGYTYHYSEGAVPFPDPLDRPSRTILTGEGGRTPSRFKHVVQTPDGRLRRLTPVELERLNGFPDGWTGTGMPEGRRAFCMGNALVVGLVERIGRVLATEPDTGLR
ncbi:MAG TPA: DNA (cytosine-5-)-methyltransferase [Actinomycetota bacterium]|nr:DNA (cytosine-5-)-methyltransferase [Actinomycetota bacterium]